MSNDAFASNHPIHVRMRRVEALLFTVLLE
jgi:hypothetical protein